MEDKRARNKAARAAKNQRYKDDWARAAPGTTPASVLRRSAKRAAQRAKAKAKRDREDEEPIVIHSDPDDSSAEDVDDDDWGTRWKAHQRRVEQNG